MASIESFEATLKEVVNGKRLSASKVTSLTDISLKIMERDTQMVSILYRTHKSLPSRSKVASLYAFDALCRAARHQAVKQGLTTDSAAEQGNSFTFLKKMEGVLEGLVEDMVTCGASEAKEKTKKILDIWTKSSTFSTDVMSRLTDVVKRAAEKESKQPTSASTSTSAPSTDPRIQPPAQPSLSPPSVLTPITTTPTPTAESAQAALLALLTTAAAAKTNNGPSSSNSAAASTQIPQQTQLDPMQLALLQQLASKASVVSLPPQNNQAAAPSAMDAAPAPTLPPVRAPEQTYPAGPSDSSDSKPLPHSYSEPFQNSDRRDPRQGRYESRGRGRGEFHLDDRRQNYQHHGAPGPRDEYRGGRGGHDDHFRRGGGRNQHHDRDRFRERGEWGPPNGRSNLSRSKSPPRSRFSDSSRDIKPYSPPHRPSLQQVPVGRSNSPEQQQQRAVPPSIESGKDEFGRDIRPDSPKRKTSISRNEATPSTVLPDTVEEPPDSYSSKAAETGESTNAPGGAQSWGLESFDLSTFNPTEAASWKALGDAFAVTNGYMPSQEELMQFIMSAMAFQAQNTGFGGFGMQTGFQGGPNVPMNEAQQWGDYPGGDFRGPSVTRGGSDAGGSTGDGYGEQGADVNSPGAGGGGTGQMKKVGDKWIFVRNKLVPP